MIRPEGPVQWTMAGILALLVLATVLVGILGRLRPQLDLANVRLRVKTWWIMATVFLFAVLLNRNVSLAFFACISFLAFKEYLSLVPTRRADRIVLFWAYLTIPLQYVLVSQEWYGMFIIFVPVYAFLLLPLRMVLIGVTQGFLKAVGTLHWGLMTTVFSLSHLAYLLVLPAAGNPNGGGAALVLYLVPRTRVSNLCRQDSRNRPRPNRS